MSDGRKRLSGAKYRAMAKYKIANQKKIIEQTSKIQSYFKRPSAVNNETILQPKPVECVLTDIENAPCSSNTASCSSLNANPEFVANIVEPFEISTSNTCNTTAISNDPGKWDINETTIDLVTKFGFKSNKDMDFRKSKKLFGDKFRCLNVQNFSKQLKNGEIRDRDYLSYSESDNALYCIPCYLFGRN